MWWRDYWFYMLMCVRRCNDLPYVVLSREDGSTRGFIMLYNRCNSLEMYFSVTKTYLFPYASESAGALLSTHLSAIISLYSFSTSNIRDLGLVWFVKLVCERTQSKSALA